MVPKILLRASRWGSLTEARRPTCAARWKTTSGFVPATVRELRCLDVGAYEAETCGTPPVALGRMRKVGRTTRAQIVYTNNLVALRKQSVDKVGADESGSAGNQDTHITNSVVAKPRANSLGHTCVFGCMCTVPRAARPRRARRYRRHAVVRSVSG